MVEGDDDANELDVMGSLLAEYNADDAAAAAEAASAKGASGPTRRVPEYYHNIRLGLDRGQASGQKADLRAAPRPSDSSRRPRAPRECRQGAQAPVGDTGRAWCKGLVVDRVAGGGEGGGGGREEGEGG